MARVHKDLQKIIRELQSGGYTVVRTEGKGGHWIVRNDQGARVYALPSTPGRGRAMQNLQSELRRRGLIARKHPTARTAEVLSQGTAEGR